jgi:hypothetical protein
MAGMSNGRFSMPSTADLIPLPKGSELFVLPGRLPVACDPDTAEPLLIEDNPFQPGEPVQAVAAFMAPAHTSILTAAYHILSRHVPYHDLGPRHFDDRDRDRTARRLVRRLQDLGLQVAIKPAA